MEAPKFFCAETNRFHFSVVFYLLTINRNTILILLTTATPGNHAPRQTRKRNTMPKANNTPANAPATPVNAPAPVQAANAPKANKAAERAALTARIATERKTATAVFAKLSEAISIPVKPLAAYAKQYEKTCTAHPIGRKPSARQAAALYVALTAAGVKLADGAAFPRKFDMRGAAYAIENGVLRSAISAKLCTYNSKTETITITKAATIAGQIKTAGFTI